MLLLLDGTSAQVIAVKDFNENYLEFKQEFTGFELNDNRSFLKRDGKWLWVLAGFVTSMVGFGVGYLTVFMSAYLYNSSSSLGERTKFVGTGVAGGVIGVGLIYLGGKMMGKGDGKSKKMRLPSKEKQLEGVEEWEHWYHEKPK